MILPQQKNSNKIWKKYQILKKKNINNKDRLKKLKVKITQ